MTPQIHPILHTATERFKPTFRFSQIDSIKEYFEFLRKRFIKDEKSNYDVLNIVRMELMDYAYNYLNVWECNVDIDFEKRILTLTLNSFPNYHVIQLDMSPTLEEVVWIKCNEALQRIYQRIDSI